MTNGRRWWTPKYNNSYDKKSGDKNNTTNVNGRTRVNSPIL